MFELEPISKQFQNNSRVENWKYSIDFHRIIIIVRQREKFLHIDKDMERLTVVSKTVVARLSNEQSIRVISIRKSGLETRIEV